MTNRVKILKILQCQTRWKMIMVQFIQWGKVSNTGKWSWSSSSSVEKCQTRWNMIMVQFIQSNTVENDHGPVHLMWKSVKHWVIMVQFIQCGKGNVGGKLFAPNYIIKPPKVEDKVAKENFYLLKCRTLCS